MHLDIGSIIGANMKQALNMDSMRLIAAKQDKLPIIKNVKNDLERIQTFFMQNLSQDSDVKKIQNKALIPKKVRPWGILRDMYTKLRNGTLASVGGSISRIEGASLNGTKNLIEAFAQGKGTQYGFGVPLKIEGLVTPDENPKWTDTALAKNLKAYTQFLFTQKSSVTKVLTGKVLDLLLCTMLDPDRSWNKVTTYFYVGIKTDPTEFQGALKAFGAHKANIDRVMRSIYLAVLEERPIPSFFLSESKLDKPFSPGHYETASGMALYIPDMSEKEFKEGREEIADALATGPDKDGYYSSFPPNTIFFPDAESESVICTDMGGNIRTFSLAAIEKPTDRFKLFLLDNELVDFEKKTSNYIRHYVDWMGSIIVKEAASALFARFPGGKVKDAIGSSEYKTFITAYETFIREAYRRISLANWMTALGMIKVYKDLIKDGTKIIRDHEEYKRKLEAATIETSPAIPNLRSDAIQFPHQAETLSKLNIATDAAIIDIGTGGGKAGILIQDCLNLLNKGLIKRPLIVMPNSLTGQFLAEIDFFTDGQVNGFAINTEAKKYWDTDQLAKGIESAPPNTIFVTSFPFLTNEGEIRDYDITGEPQSTFKNVKWLRQFNFDYLAVDESQNIKRPTTSSAQAIYALGRGVKYKRISTGTLISNKPEDLVGQIMFLDPRILGNLKAFAEKYAIGGNLKNGTKNNFAQEVRARLKTGAAYLRYTEKDWASLLPKRHYSLVRVPMTEVQAKVYKALVQKVVDDIKKDEKIAKLWEKMKEEGGELEEVPANLLGKMARLEIYLTAPDSQALLEDADKDSISVKMGAIDDLIEKSLKMKGPNNKVIVATHYKDPAKHLWKHSRFKDQGAYYDASKKSLIEEFQKPDSKIKVLFAVINSIKEGHNLQIANRLIIADTDWTPGNLKQLEARIFRPHVRFENGKVINLNKGKEVFIDTVMADDSADCLKFAVQVFKKITNSVIMDDCEIEPPEKVVINEAVLSAKFTDPLINGRVVEDRNKEFNKWSQDLIDQFAKKGDLKFIATKKAQSKIGFDKAEVPWIKGMALPIGEGEEPMLDFLAELGMDTTLEELVYDDEAEGSPSKMDLRIYKDKLMGCKVRVEEGEGHITGVYKNSLKVFVSGVGELKNARNPGIIIHKIGSVGSSRSSMRPAGERVALDNGVRTTRQRPDVRSPEVRTARTVKVGETSGDDAKRSRYLVVKYLNALGIVPMKRMKQHQVVLTLNGVSLGVTCPVKGFTDHTLGEWKQYAQQLIEMVRAKGYDVDGALPEVKEEPKALTRPKKEGKRALDSKHIALSPEEKAAADADLQAIMDEDDPEGDAINLPESSMEPETRFTGDLEDEEENAEAADSELQSMLDKLEDDIHNIENATSKVSETIKRNVRDATNSLPEGLEDDEDLGNPIGDADDLELPEDGEDDGEGLSIGDFKAPDEDEEENTVPIRLEFGTYDTHPCLIHIPDEDDKNESVGEELDRLGFEWFGKYWSYEVRSFNDTARMLKNLQKKYKLVGTPLNTIGGYVSSIKSRKYKVDWLGSDIAEFKRTDKKKAAEGTLRLMTLTIGTRLFLIASALKNPGVALAGFKFHEESGFYMLLEKDSASMKRALQRAKNDLNVEGTKQLKDVALTNFKVTLS